jgi:hypothetical protein
MHSNWAQRYIGVLCFGSIIEGPKSDDFVNLVRNALPMIYEMLND